MIRLVYQRYKYLRHLFVRRKKRYEKQNSNQTLTNKPASVKGTAFHPSSLPQASNTAFTASSASAKKRFKKKNF
jgi:hypothetical protein